MSTQQDQAHKGPKSYNLIGVISELAAHPMKADGKTFQSFKLTQSSGKTTSCVAFDDKGAALVAAFQNGDTVKLLGIYENRPYTNAKGEKRMSRRFKVRWSGIPQPKQAAEAPAEASAAA